MMNGKRLAQVAHGELIDRLAKAQATLLKIRQLRDMFGDDALPPNAIFRSHNDALAGAKESMALLEKHTQKDIQEYTATIREIELALKSDDDASLQAFAKDMAERLKAGRAAEKAAAPKWRAYREKNGEVVLFAKAEHAHAYVKDTGLTNARVSETITGAWGVEVLR